MPTKDLISIDREVQLPSDWNYETSVVKCRNLFREVREKGAEALTELYIAHELLIEDSKKKIGRKWPDKTFETYCEETGINPDTGYEWLHRYFGLPRRKLGKPSIPLLPEGKFDVIYADPPWRYEFSETESRSIEAHYDTLLLEKICYYKDPAGTPVQDKFAADAVLFLWSPSPKLFESFSVIKEWGFDYRTCAVWKKDKIGMGYFFRQQHELLLVARKGNMPVPEPANRPSSIIEAQRLNHSRKPDEVYEMIMKMYPRDRYLELFGKRQYNEKWVVFGVLEDA
jgi:N6-adenosine-specific RNA methylase IME4